MSAVLNQAHRLLQKSLSSDPFLSPFPHAPLLQLGLHPGSGYALFFFTLPILPGKTYVSINNEEEEDEEDTSNTS